LVLGVVGVAIKSPNISVYRPLQLKGHCRKITLTTAVPDWDD